MRVGLGTVCLVIVAIVALSVALAHLSCLYFGPQCYSAQMAPEVIVESARDGTWLAPVGNLIASSIFVVIGFYALSASAFIRALPFLSAAIYIISAVCIIRGILPIQLWFRYPERLSNFEIWAGIIWLIAGLLLLVGYRIKLSTSAVTNEN